ncbi:MAG: MFS transporter, partial [Promethearchaeati archaeon]
RFFGKRQFISSIFILFTSLIAANFIEFWKNNYVEYEIISYSILFFTAFIFGMISLFYIYKVPEPIMNLRENKLKFSKLLLNPLKNKNYKHLLGFLAFWSFGTNLITPFFVVYLLDTLNFSLPFVVILTIVSQISNLLFLRLWGRLADIYSNKTIFKVCCPLFIICIFLFSLSFIFNNSIFLILLLIITYLLIGISTSGILLSTGNISLKLTPKGEGTSYLAITTIITSFSLGIAPIIGSALYDFLKTIEYKIDFTQSLSSININGVFILFCIAIIIGICSIWFLLQIEEKGDIKGIQFFREFIIEMKNSLSNFSITIGFRDILFVTSLSLTYRALKRKIKVKEKLKK